MGKLVYVVRHGETDANRANQYQGGNNPLGARGLEQAEMLANRFVHTDLELIVSSDMLRARQTAEAIARKTDKTIELSPLFREIRRPSSLIGKDRLAPGGVEYHHLFYERADDPDWHFEDEENMADLKARALEALHFIEERQEQKIVVVTHAVFKLMLLSVMLFGEKLRGDIWQAVVQGMNTSNTGVTLLEYDTFWWKHKQEPQWLLQTWNDHAHLAE